MRYQSSGRVLSWIQGGGMSVGVAETEPGPGDSGKPPRVFVSYSHDSAEHVEMVRRFATFLREQAGVDAHLDRWYEDGRRDWSLWAVQQLDTADFILVIASPRYKRSAEGTALPTDGRGAQFESAIIRNDLTRDLAAATRRALPVVLPGRSIDEIPSFLCGYSSTHYVVRDFTMDGIEDLRVALTGVPIYRMPPLGRFTPPTRPAVEPVVVATSAPSVPVDAKLSAGAEVEIGNTRYLVHGDGLEEVAIADHAAMYRQARALRIGPPHEHVWLRQIEERQRTPAVRTAFAEIRREYDLLRDLRTGGGVPRPYELVADDGLATLVTAWPTSPSTGSPCATMLPFVPKPDETVDPARMFRMLGAFAELCRTLSRLHDLGVSHRHLTPSGIIRLDDGRLVPRDLGLAARAQQRGEGPAEYRAPEQQRRSSGQVGPWTDVYQLAAVTRHLITGHPPVMAIPVPVRAYVPTLPAQIGDVLDAALAADPVDRPDVSALSVALRVGPDRRY
jgi:SEFIR domain